jgi:hypothetical protein
VPLVRLIRAAHEQRYLRGVQREALGHDIDDLVEVPLAARVDEERPRLGVGLQGLVGVARRMTKGRRPWLAAALVVLVRARDHQADDEIIRQITRSPSRSRDHQVDHEITSPPRSDDALTTSPHHHITR